DRDAAFEEVSAALDRLAIPRTKPPEAGSSTIVSLGHGLVGTLSSVSGFSNSLTSLRTASPDVYSAASFWWTAGGGGFPPLALSCRGLPDPFHYATFLSGNLQEASTAR